MRTIFKTGSLIAGMVAVTMLVSSCMRDYENPAEGVVNGRTFIHVLRDSYKGGEMTISSAMLAGGTSIQGVIISDKTGTNMEPGNFVIQQTVPSGNQVGDITRGIALRFTGTDPGYNIGDSLVINVAGSTLGRVNGRLTVSGIDAAKVTKLAENKTPLTRPVTLAMLGADMINYESTLVTVHADIADYAAGQNYKGERKLADGTASDFVLRTRNEAAFGDSIVPLNAQFTGIVGFFKDGGNDTAGAKKSLTLRTKNDINFKSGALYAGYPESFETPDFTAKASYNITATNNDITLATGSWKLLQAILGNTLIRDKANLPGKQCIRMQQNLTTSAMVQMNFDLTQGASKLTVFYGKYYTDPVSTFRLEYSINGGTTWVVVAPNISDMPERGSKQATFMLNLTGNVRFRINKLGLGASSSTVNNGRLCIDDIAIYKK